MKKITLFLLSTMMLVSSAFAQKNTTATASAALTVTPEQYAKVISTLQSSTYLDLPNRMETTMEKEGITFLLSYNSGITPLKTVHDTDMVWVEGNKGGSKFSLMMMSHDVYTLDAGKLKATDIKKYYTALMKQLIPDTVVVEKTDFTFTADSAVDATQFGALVDKVLRLPQKTMKVNYSPSASVAPLELEISYNPLMKSGVVQEHGLEVRCMRNVGQCPNGAYNSTNGIPAFSISIVKGQAVAYFHSTKAYELIGSDNATVTAMVKAIVAGQDKPTP